MLTDRLHVQRFSGIVLLGALALAWCPADVLFHQTSLVAEASAAPRTSERAIEHSEEGDRLTGLEIVPDRATLKVGDEIELLAVGAFAGGWVEDLTESVSWTSRDRDVLTVGSSGVGTARSSGTARIRIEREGLAAEAVIEVIQPA